MKHGSLQTGDLPGTQRMRVGFWNREPLADVSLTPQPMRRGALGWHPCLPGAVFRVRSWSQGRLWGAEGRPGRQGQVAAPTLPVWALGQQLASLGLLSCAFKATSMCCLAHLLQAGPHSVFPGTLPGAGTGPPPPRGCLTAEGRQPHQLAEQH